MRSYNTQKQKAGIFLANKMAFLVKKKYTQQKNEFWSVLLNLKIESHIKNS
jgi:hypothetical protein